MPHFIVHCDYSERLPWTSYRAADDRGKGLFSATWTLGRPRPRRRAGGSCENHGIDAPDLAGFPDGTPLAEIAAAYGVPVRTARIWVAAGPRPAPAPPKVPRSRPDVDAVTVAALYADGLNQAQIAVRLGCGHSTVQRRLEAAGAPSRPRNTPKVDAQIANRYVAGEPVAKIAATLGMTQSGIDRALRRVGIKRRRQPQQPTPGRVAGRNGVRRPDIDASDIVAMHQAGWSQVAIAEHYECSRALIRNRLRAAGVPTRRGR